MNEYKNEYNGTIKKDFITMIILFNIIIITHTSFASPTLASLSLQNTTSGDLVCGYSLGGQTTSAALSWYKNGAPLTVLYLPFDGGVGNALFDYSGNNNNAQGSPMIVNDGISGDAMDFTGELGDGIDISPIDISPTSDFTTSLWFRNANPNVDGGLMEKSGNFFSDGVFILLSINGRADFKLFNGTDEIPFLSGFHSTYDTNWHHVVVGFNQSTGFLYLDGVLVDNKTISGKPGNGLGNLYIGKAPMDSKIFNGSIDEVRIYDYALSHEQIVALYDNNLNQKIVSNEISIGETWQCKGTGFDSNSVGFTYSSNIFTSPDPSIIPDTTPPIITLNGESNVSVDLGTPFYVELWATAIDDVDGPVNVVVTGADLVDTYTVGTYEVTYTAQDSSGNVAQVIRTVNVVWVSDITSPVITLYGPSNINLQINTPYVELDAYATDNIDPVVTVDISGFVNTSKVGTYFITYNAQDSSGNNATPVIRTVNVINSSIVPDTTKPIITINGSTNISIEINTPYVELGASATDNIDGVVNVTISGFVNTSKVGVYNIFYNAQDLVGNNATPVIRTVNVINSSIVPDTTRPIVKINGAANVTIKVNSNYIELSANATDNIDGIINVTISGFVNTSVIGNYIITYRARDSSGNNGSKIRNVSVVPLTRQCALNDTEIIENDTDELYINKSNNNLTKVFIPKEIDDYKEINLILTDLKDENSTIYLVNNITLNREGLMNPYNYSVYIFSNTTITGELNWDGKFSLPTLKHSENYNVGDATPNIVINLGNENSGLNFSNPIRIIIGNMSNKKAAYGMGTTLKEITTKCDNETYPTNIDILNIRECYIDSGNDLVIWSFHLTTFAAYTPVVPPQASGGNNGGGSHSRGGSAFSYISNITTTKQNETKKEEIISNTPLKKPIEPSTISEDITRISTDNINQDSNENKMDTTTNPSSKESNLVTGNSVSTSPKPSWLFAIIISALVVIVCAYFLFSIQKKHNS
ncbi:MAG: immunoglobulin-like domain-containing protein [Candidatus Woesearchaeota archaeon]|jgi:hypothetical protein